MQPFIICYPSIFETLFGYSSIYHLICHIISSLFFTNHIKFSMRHIFTVIALSFSISFVSAQIGINSTGTAPASSAMLDVSSTTKGFLPPRMTTTHRTAITSPSAGLVVFDTDKNQLFVFSNGTWNAIAAPTYPRLSTEDIDAIVSPQVGDLAYDLTFKCLKQYNGIRWLCTNQDPDNIKPTMTAWGAGGASVDIGYSIALDVSGNIYVTGIFGGIATFGNTTITSSGTIDIFIVKYSDKGEFQWVQKAGGNYDDYGSAVKLDALGNVYVTGFFNNTATFGNTSITSSGFRDIFLAKYDGSGTLLWVQKAGSSADDQATSIALDNLGNIYITGSFNGTATFGLSSITSSGATDIFIAKYNSAGSLLLIQKAGGTSNESGASIAVDNSGYIYLTGNFAGTAIFGSFTVYSNSGTNDIFITKYNNLGSCVWVERAGGSGNSDFGSGLALDNYGNIYVTGEFENIGTFGSNNITSSGYGDIFITKYDGYGSCQWVRKAGTDTQYESGRAIAVDSQSNVYMTGSFDGNALFGNVSAIGVYDIFIAKYNSAGIFQWLQKAGGTNLEVCSSIAISTSGNIYATGFYNSTNTNFGSTVLSSNGLSDILILRLKE
jgi:hypothetical protein